jgi:hypothetical protein
LEDEDINEDDIEAIGYVADKTQNADTVNAPAKGEGREIFGSHMDRTDYVH